MSENKHTPVETFDCQGCRPYCYGGYHMEADKDGLGDYVKAEDYRAIEKQRDELMAALGSGRRHCNDNTPHSDLCEAIIDSKEADVGQGLDPFWKWAFRRGFHEAESSYRIEIANLEKQRDELLVENASLKTEFSQCSGLLDDAHRHIEQLEAEVVFQRNAHDQAQALLLEQGHQLAASSPNYPWKGCPPCDGGSRAGYECPVCRQSDCRGCVKCGAE